MKKIITVCLVLILIPFLSHANNISISNIIWDAGSEEVTFDISWDNSYTDGAQWYHWAWVFIKYKNANASQWHQLPIDELTSVSGNIIPQIQFADNSPNGFGIKLIGNASGSISGTISFSVGGFETLISPSFKVFGIEMVHMAYSNGQDFYLGDGVAGNRFHKGDDDSQPYFSDMSLITIGNGPNDLQVKGGTIAGTTIPIPYPKNPYSVMKYEISQEQYVEFLNTLTREQQINRVQTDISGTSVTNVYVMPASTVPTGRNGIRCDAILPIGGPINFYCDYDGNGTGNQVNDGQNIACNYLLPADLLAYLDWAGLRPMSEFEYEFLCRGTENAVSGEFAWGTSMKTSASVSGSQGGPGEVPSNLGSDGLVRIVGSGPLRCGFAATGTSNRSTSGSTFYGVMEMTGNLSEMVVGLTSVTDLEFDEDDSGDGILSIDGGANEASWPTNLTWRGAAASFSSVQSVSQRNTVYVSNSVRSKNMGGRGVPVFN